jgi:hypothetical protein
MIAETSAPDPLETCACVCGCAASAVYSGLRLCANCADLNQGDRRRALPENYPENHIQPEASRELERKKAEL